MNIDSDNKTFVYCTRSQTGGGKGLEMRLVRTSKWCG